MPRILLIDDRSGEAPGLEYDLHDGGFHVTTVPVGREGLTLIRGRPDFDLVLLNLNSSEAEDLQFIREAKDQRSGTKIFVVVPLTPPVKRDVIGLLISLGADDAMFRPYLPEFLRWRIKDLIRGERILV